MDKIVSDAKGINGDCNTKVTDILIWMDEDESLVGGKIDNLVKKFTADDIADAILYNILLEESMYSSEEVFSANKILILLDEFFSRDGYMSGDKKTFIKLDSIFGTIHALSTTKTLTYDENLFIKAQFKLKKIIDNLQLKGKHVASKLDERVKLKNVKNVFELKEGSMVGVRGCDLLTTCLYKEDNSIIFQVPSMINYEPILQDSILLLSYEGNSIWREFYTGLEVYVEKSSLVNNAVYETPEKSCNAFRVALRTPLVIDSNLLHVFDDNLKNTLVIQDAEAITKAINRINDSAKERIISQVSSIYAADYEDAKRVDAIETRLSAFKRQSKANMSLEKKIGSNIGNN